MLEEVANSPEVVEEMSGKLTGAGENPGQRTSDGAKEGALRQVVLVRIADLVEADLPRLGGINDAHVGILAEVEAPLPPICVHHGTMRIIDGVHRVRAARLKGRDVIEAWFFHGSLDDAFCLSVRENMAHGLPLTTVDRQAAAARILRTRPELSDRAIALVTGIAARTVAGVRRRLGDTTAQPVRVGRDGRVRPLNAAEGRRRAAKVVLARPDASLREIARESGVSVGTARDVRSRVRAGESPVPSESRIEHRDAGAASPAVAREPRPVVTGRLPTRTPEMELDMLLDGLRRDPSLRYTDSGRTFLRWLMPQVCMVAQWRDATSSVPPHCNVVVARVARECARVWSDVADQLDGFHRECA
ncbi:ParB/RepB/Spo0J family partition protein [Micromonospora sp. NPDC049240]|uniref:ParB/RepB/Spo0J family partition protein n=1 Tax=Micromonospora sp. NPDC049240 TaxID=3155151 RepID=UPI0033F2DE97